MAWPPTLPELKRELKLPADDTRDDERLKACLSAAVGFVEDVHAARWSFATPPSARPAPGATVELGTLRLAMRWHRRRDSPDGVISSGEFGTFRVGSGDPDIDRMLKIGRHRPPVLA